MSELGLLPDTSEPAPKPGRVKARRRRQERGVALVLVLGALTILAVMLTDFQDETSAELGSALSARDSLRAEYAARSAIQLSRLLIASEPTIRKGLAPLLMLLGGSPPQIPVWQFGDQILGAFNDASGAEKFAALAGVQMDKGKKLGIEGAGFDIDIIDEDSKINLNSAWRDPLTQTRLAAQILGLIGGAQFEPLFTARDGDGQYSDRLAICGALIDWVDANQELTTCDLTGASGPSTGTEDSFYQQLDPPYYRKNAPLDSLEELHMVRGVSDDFWSNFIDPDPTDPRKRNVTVWGSGKINVNTANAQTILALICGGTVPPAKMCTDPIEAMKFLSMVNVIRMLTQGAPIFGTPQFFLDALAQKNFVGTILQKMGIESRSTSPPGSEGEEGDLLGEQGLHVHRDGPCEVRQARHPCKDPGCRRFPEGAVTRAARRESARTRCAAKALGLPTGTGGHGGRAQGRHRRRPLAPPYGHGYSPDGLPTGLYRPAPRSTGDISFLVP